MTGVQTCALPICILAEKGKYRELKDFVGKRIAISQGSNAQQAVVAALKKLGDPEPKVMSFQNNAECFLALKAGKVDGYTNDTIILAGVIVRSEERQKAFRVVLENMTFGSGSPSFFRAAATAC